jgi:hypothetical protein
MHGIESATFATPLDTECDDPCADACPARWKRPSSRLPHQDPGSHGDAGHDPR